MENGMAKEINLSNSMYTN